MTALCTGGTSAPTPGALSRAVGYAVGEGLDHLTLAPRLVARGILLRAFVAFFAYAFPAPDGFQEATLSPPAAHWDAELGEYILNWEDVCAAPDPHRAVLDFGLSTIRHACMVCGWDPDLAASAEGVPPPVV